MANKKQPRKLITAALQVLESLDNAHELGGNSAQAREAALGIMKGSLAGTLKASEIQCSPETFGFDPTAKRSKQRAKRVGTSLERFAQVVEVAPEGMAEGVVGDIERMFA